MHTETRTRPIHKLVLHDNEGPEGMGSAAQLRNYLYRNGADGGGYQAVFDDRYTVTVASDQTVCYANGAINHESIDGCLIGYARQSQAEWADLFDAGGPGVPGAIENAAQWFASKCRMYGIPPVHLTGDALHDPNSKGICTHGDLTRAGYPGTEGHSDPGDQFPIDKFVWRVADIVSPPIDLKFLVRLEKFKKRIAIRPLRQGDKGADVETMTLLLVFHGCLKKATRRYTWKVALGVRRFKKLRKYKAKDLNGRVFGLRAVEAAFRS